MNPVFWSLISKFLIFSHLLGITSTSDCDVEFTYSEYYNSNGFKVTCSDVTEGQEEIIRDIPAQNAIILDIKNTTLANVSSDLFANVPKLKELNIYNSNISVNGTVDLFSKLDSLQTLKIKDTVIKGVGNGTFSNLVQLRVLHLENNSLNFITKDGLKLEGLESLLFINNNLENVDDIPLCYLENIAKINFSKNKIRSLQPNLYQCSSRKAKQNSLNSLSENNHLGIEYLDLSNNEITSIQNAFSSLSNLEYLNLANNSISRIYNTDFKNTTQLQTLNLSNNTISSISNASFNRLYDLREINLSNNRITKVQLTFLAKLAKVDLSHNKLTFDNLYEMNMLPGLETLDLSHNELNGTSNIFNKFFSLVSLYLNDNNLILEEDMFRNLTQLEILNLSGNGIIYLPETIFSNLTSLRELDLSRNELDTLDDLHIFSSLISVQMLNLSFNYLHFLNHNLFSNLDDCEILDLAGNKLKDLDYAYIINTMRSLDTINLNNNMFSCNFLHKAARYFSWKDIKYNIDNITEYNEENIGGIHCREDSISDVETVRTNSKNTSIFFVCLVSAIFSIFVLLVILVIKYYQIYRRSKYHSEQFELIQD